MQRSRRLGLCLALLAAGVPAAYGAAPHAPVEAVQKIAAELPLHMGSLAPDFSRPDLSHKPVTLSAYRGRVVLLNFWASWCEPCMTELPRFRAWQRRYRARGLQVVGVSMDDDAARARAADHKLQLNFPVVMGSVRLARLYGGIYGVPVTFLIDRRGRIDLIETGAANLPRLQRHLEALLRRP